MQSASFEAQYAPISQRGYIVANLTEPYLFNFDVPLTLAVFASREPIQDIDIERFGVFLESARQFGVAARGPAVLLPADRAQQPAGPLDDRPREVPALRLPDQAVGDRPEPPLRPPRRRPRSAEGATT